MQTQDRACSITFNGEVYNFRQLRAELDGYGVAWRSDCDTEVVLQAYQRWGADCLSRLHGMFAFAIWDDRRRQLLLARDRFGIKPLYYYAGEGFLVFSSEIRALLASGVVPRTLDPLALWQYLAYQCVPAPRTMFENVRLLPPGSWLTIDASGKLIEQRYWDLLEQAGRQSIPGSQPEVCRQVGSLLREAVASHLVSDVPVATFLSGGIDSSTIVALMREAGVTPRTFTVGFAETAYDESQHARRVSETLQTEHFELLLRENELLDEIPDALAAMDHPTGDGINTYVVSRAVRSVGIKVALSGLGGDELFAGYPSFARLARSAGPWRLWGRAPRQVRALVADAVRSIGPRSVATSKLASMLASDGSLAALYPTTREVLSRQQRCDLVRQPWLSLVASAAEPYDGLLRSAFDGALPAQTLSLISYAEARTYLHDLLLRDTDQMSMAHGLEVRVPFLDHRLAEYIVSLPNAVKRANGTPKRLLVESLGGLLPPEVVQRPKQGFTLPFTPWMRGPLRSFCEQRLGPKRLGGRGIFKPEALAAHWQDFLADRPTVTWSRVWLLVALEEWLERHAVDLPELSG